MAFPTPGNRIPDAWERHSQPVGNAPLQSGRHLYGRVGLAPCTHLLHCSWLWRRKFPASRPITLRTYMNARLPAMRKATICCFCVQRSISPCKTDRGRCSPSPLASAEAGRQCDICPYPITMDITAERRGCQYSLPSHRYIDSTSVRPFFVSHNCRRRGRPPHAVPCQAYRSPGSARGSKP